jgi:hypothetical protein
VTVRPDEQRATNSVNMRKPAQLTDRCYTLFVGGLNSATTDATIKRFFSAFGQVATVHTRQGSSSNPDSHSYVSFRDAASIDAVMRSRPLKLELKTLVLRRLARIANKPPAADSQTTYLRVRIPNTDEPGREELAKVQDYFQKFGKVSSSETWADNQILVKFEDYDSVDKVALCLIHTLDQNGPLMDVHPHHLPDIRLAEILREEVIAENGESPSAGTILKPRRSLRKSDSENMID